MGAAAAACFVGHAVLRIAGLTDETWGAALFWLLVAAFLVLVVWAGILLFQSAQDEADEEFRARRDRAS